VKSLRCLEYPELGMEAVWMMEVENLPAFVLVDDKGNNSSASLSSSIAAHPARPDIKEPLWKRELTQTDTASASKS
jgi:fumarate hydratase class I